MNLEGLATLGIDPFAIDISLLFEESLVLEWRYLVSFS